MNLTTTYRTQEVDGLSIFYREAGPKDAPALLLLHGLPSSSRMFEPLFTRLSDRYRLIAPDYPGFGHSDWPDPKQFAYTFDHYAEIMNRFTEALGLSRYTLYMQDYGGPVGFRMILAHPQRVEALIVQDAVAHNEGLGVNWKTRRAFWADRATNESALRANLLSLSATRTRHVGNDPNLERYDPDLWTDEFYFINRPGQAEIQSDLFYDYRTNVDAYPKWQAWMREKQPRLLVIWGKYELSFEPGEPERYRTDVPNAEIHIVDGGHFALDTAADQVAAFVQGFIRSSREANAQRAGRGCFGEAACPVVYRVGQVASQTAVYNLPVSQDGYWQPIVRCKTPDCVDGDPIYLPHPDLPETTEPQPNWPAENWHPVLVCKYCGRGYHYHAKDVEWIITQYYTGLPDNDLMLLAELRCAQPDCEHLIKVYLGSDVRKKIREITGKLQTGTKDATCDAGHAPAHPLDVFQINSVDELE